MQDWYFMGLIFHLLTYEWEIWYEFRPLLQLMAWCQLASMLSCISNLHLLLAATKQLYQWSSPSVCPSVCHTFSTMFPSLYHHEIFRSDSVFPKSRQHVCFVRHRIQMSDVEFVKIISIRCLSVQFGRRSMKSIREDWWLPMTEVRSIQKVKVRGQSQRSKPNVAVSGPYLRF